METLHTVNLIAKNQSSFFSYPWLSVIWATENNLMTIDLHLVICVRYLCNDPLNLTRLTKRTYNKRPIKTFIFISLFTKDSYFDSSELSSGMFLAHTMCHHMLLQISFISILTFSGLTMLQVLLRDFCIFPAMEYVLCALRTTPICVSVWE